MPHILAILFLLFSSSAFAQEAAIEGLQLADVKINAQDIASIKRGASFFASNCLSCHTLIYLRNDKVAQEAGITYAKMPVNIKNWPNGVTPPDLSLEVHVRGAKWIYTYLHSFYPDSTRPTGFNNLVFPGTAMPNIIGPYQGEQVLVSNPTRDIMHQLQWYDVLKLTKQGTMTPEQFDATITDLINFLAYAAEPYQAEQHRIGWWVLGFLIILFVMLYVLKKEYWKDIKKRRE
jgi:ubiquinol-cytochrome c reductase cytochrome c1 subunit